MINVERLGVIIAPDEEYQAKFNAGMVEANGVVHMLYRYAEKLPRWYNRDIDWDFFFATHEFPYVHNCIRYARLNLDGTLAYDSNATVLAPSTSDDALGCEDARIIPFEGAYYLVFCAYDGQMPRIALCRTTDFVTYEKMGAIHHEYADKDAFIFPERIDGRIALVHRVLPNIQLEYFDSFEDMLRPESWVERDAAVEEHTILRGLHGFEAKKIGGGVPPIKTEYGWLLIYHGVDAAGIYHTCAALLELEDPGKVIARLPYPLMSPETEYERSGDYRGCLFVQGYYVHNDSLYLSYGSADKYTAMARLNFDELIETLRTCDA